MFLECGSLPKVNIQLSGHPDLMYWVNQVNICSRTLLRVRSPLAVLAVDQQAKTVCFNLAARHSAASKGNVYSRPDLAEYIVIWPLKLFGVCSLSQGSTVCPELFNDRPSPTICFQNLGNAANCTLFLWGICFHKHKKLAKQIR